VETIRKTHLIRFPFFDIILFIDEKGNQIMNELLQALMSRKSINKDEAIAMILEHFEESGMDAELTLWSLGFEPDYCFDLIDICARN
jgi:hypothetical protein